MTDFNMELCPIFSKMSENDIPGFGFKSLTAIESQIFRASEIQLRYKIVLPEGYEWKFDPSCGCISIYDPTGISSADTNQPTVKDAYHVTGRKAEKGEKGLQIQRMSDGNVKKTITK